MISIILPVYNGEKYISKAIMSCLNQNYYNVEVIVVDDGSVDETRKVISKVQDKRIRYYYIKNSGQALARNFGIAKARGEYIALLDADDIYINSKLEKQIEILKENKEIDFVYNDAYLINEDDKIIDKLSIEVNYEKKEDIYAYTLFRQIIPCPASMMIRRQCFENIIYPENYRFAEDYKFILELIKRYRGYYLNEPLYLYRKHNTNLTNRHDEQVMAEKNIVKELGEEEIIQAIENSSFVRVDKDMLLAKIFLKIDEDRKALKILESIKEKNEYVFFYIGNTCFKQENLQDAKKAYVNAISKKENPEFYNNLGVVYYKQGDEKKAKKLFKKALELKKDYMDPKHNLTCVSSNIKLTERELRKQLMSYV